MKNVISKVLPSIFVVILLLSSYTGASAQPAPPAGETLHYSLNDSAGLKAFIDEEMLSQMKENNVPGAAIAIVKDGRLAYSAGYGYADIENRTPVVANETLFRIGSVTKLFTATAVMQLAERGNLDLNADVNDYLADFKIPDTYGRHITLNDLLTHSAGFEVQEGYGRTIVIDPERMMPLEEYLVRDMPARVRPPGEAASYSNYGMALAGYIVEQASGTPYDRYVEQNILMPLAMENTTAQQPVPYPLGGRLSRGYVYSNGAYRSVPFEYIVPAPAGSISSTATDMAAFMIAQLNDGRLGNASIMNVTTAENMHSRHFAGDPRICGMAYGFKEAQVNGMRALEQGGATTLFTSELILVPAENLGIFMAFNAGGGYNARENILRAFFDRYYPAPASGPIRPMEGYKERASRYALRFTSTSTSWTTNEKIVGGMSGQFGIHANDNGTIGIGDKNFIEVEPGLFKELNGTWTLAFREDGNGRIKYMFVNAAPAESMMRIQTLNMFIFHMALLAACIVIFVSAPAIWLAQWLRGRRKPGASGPMPRNAKLLSAIVCILDIIFVVAFAMTFLSSMDALQYGVPLALYVVLAIPIITTALTVGILGLTLLAWHKKYWSLPGRLYYTIVTVAMLVFIWVLNFWNLLGYKF